MSRTLLLTGHHGAQPAPYPFERRDPLPPRPLPRAAQPGPPEAGAWALDTEPYYRVLPFTPPDRRDPWFFRGNFQIDVPGFSDGFNDKRRSLVITWQLPAFPETAQAAILAFYVRRYSHLVLSIPQTRNLGKTLEDLEAVVARCEDLGLYVILNVMGGDREDFDRDVVPWLDRLMAYTCIKVLCVAWQIDKTDKFDSDGRPYTQALVDLTLKVVAYAHAHGRKAAQHWINGACALDPYPEYGIFDRFDYGAFMAGKVDFQFVQINTEADLGTGQVAIMEVLKGHPPPTGVVPTEYETDAIDHDPDHRLEIYGDQKGRYLLCSRFGSRVCEYGALGGLSADDGGMI